MTAQKEMESGIQALSQYCSSRYGITLTDRHLVQLVGEYNFCSPADGECWLKSKLYELGYFNCGCSSPPLIRLLTTIHMNWQPGKGEITATIDNLLRQEKYPPVGISPCDRRRAGRNPTNSDSAYHGFNSAAPLLSET